MELTNFSSTCNFQKEINQVKYNLCIQSHDQGKTMHRSTSTQAKWNFSFYPYTSGETSSSRPSIEYVKLFLNRFLTDLANERCELVSLQDQSNTNFVQLKNKCFEETIETNPENNSQFEISKILTPNNLLEQNINSIKDMESINSFDSYANFNENPGNLIDSYSKKLFALLIIVKVRSVVKRIIRKILKVQTFSKKNDCSFENVSQTEEPSSSLAINHCSNEAEIIFYEDFQKGDLVDINMSTVKVDYSPNCSNLETKEPDQKCNPSALDSHNNTSMKPPLNEKKLIKTRSQKMILKRSFKSICKIHKPNQCGCHLDIKWNPRFILHGDCEPVSVLNKPTLFYKLFTSIHKNRSNNILKKSVNRNLSIGGKKYYNNLHPYKDKHPMKNRPAKLISKLDQTITEYKFYPVDDTGQLEGNCEVVVEISS